MKKWQYCIMVNLFTNLLKRKCKEILEEIGYSPKLKQISFF